MSLGTEHRKTRISEHFQPTHTLPSQRGGTVPGAAISGGGGRQGRGAYSVHTLQGNWYEEKFDSRNVEGKANLPTELEQSWVSSKKLMEKESASGFNAHGQAHQLVGSAEAQLSATTIGLLAKYGGDAALGRTAAKANEIAQTQYVDIVDGRHRAFPGHQPENDLETRKLRMEGKAAAGITTETRTQFLDPIKHKENKRVNIADTFTGPARDKTGFVMHKIREAMKHRSGGGGAAASAEAVEESVYPTIASRSKKPAAMAQPSSVGGADGEPVRYTTNFSFAGLRRALAVAECKSLIPSIKKGDGLLNIEELKDGLVAYGVSLEPDEYVVLFKSFDRDGTGEVPIEQVISGIRGQMNDRRRSIVERAYRLLETTVARARGGGGQNHHAHYPPAVHMRDVLEFFDAKAHPYVQSGAFSADFARSHLFEDFFHLKGAERERALDNIITQEAFVGWYEDWSGLVSADHGFELSVRNCWHISGGEGLARNTSCRNVEVIHTNGRITREQIVDDLGISGDDMALMIQNLEKQGIRDVKRINLNF